MLGKTIYTLKVWLNLLNFIWLKGGSIMTKQEQDKFVEFYKDHVNIKREWIKLGYKKNEIDKICNIIYTLQDLADCLEFDLQTACSNPSD